METRNRHIFTSVANSVTYLKIKSWIRDLAFRILEMNKACDLPTKTKLFQHVFIAGRQRNARKPESDINPSGTILYSYRISSVIKYFKTGLE